MSDEYDFTGNPFVDTGLSVLVVRAREAGWMGETIQQLTSEAVQYAVGDGKWLTRANRRLNAFSMVVGNNSPLTNTSSNPSLRKSIRGKLSPEEDKGFQEYVTILQALVAESTLPLKGIAGLCECCVTRPPSQVLAASAKEIGRDWFPLAAEACQVHEEDAYYGHLVSRLLACLVCSTLPAGPARGA